MSLVVIAQKRMPRYRLGFFERLRADLSAAGHDLEVLVGQDSPSESLRQDSSSLPWTRTLPARYLAGERICWQPFRRWARAADLVIVTHENKLLYNHWLTYVARPKRLALWGHGANLQDLGASGIRADFKRRTALTADWWFAYTNRTARLLIEQGYDSGRIAVLNNSIDTQTLARAIDAVPRERLAALRDQYRLGEGPVALYIGSLYDDKRVDWLVDSFATAQRQVPQLRLIIVGDGPYKQQLLQWIEPVPGAHYVGPAWGNAKAEWLALADFMLNPGAVGLGILDSFASGKPLLTTACATHGPEIEYLAPERNGLMTEDSSEAFTQALIRLAGDTALRRRLSEATEADLPRYSVEAMSQSFVAGVNAALANEPLRFADPIGPRDRLGSAPADDAPSQASRWLLDGEARRVLEVIDHRSRSRVLHAGGDCGKAAVNMHDLRGHRGR